MGAKSIMNFRRLDKRYGDMTLRVWLTSCMLQLGKQIHILHTYTTQGSKSGDVQCPPVHILQTRVLREVSLQEGTMLEERKRKEELKNAGGGNSICSGNSVCCSSSNSSSK